MNAGEALEAARSFAFATLAERLGDGGLVVIAPHPDDESLACGGLIAEAHAQGRLGPRSHRQRRNRFASRQQDIPEGSVEGVAGKRSERGRRRAWTRS